MRILAIGAHPDDVELGCGATLARFVSDGASALLLVLTDGTLGPTGYDSRRVEQEAAAQTLGVELHWSGHPDGHLTLGPTLVRELGQVISWFAPDLIFTHSESDSHQDHVVAAKATLAAARNQPQILHYEAPSTLSFTPTVFCDVDGYVEPKLAALRCHLSQVVGASRVDLEAVEAQARFRGHQARVRFAEAFETTRCLLGPVASAREVIDLRNHSNAVSTDGEIGTT